MDRLKTARGLLFVAFAGVLAFVLTAVADASAADKRGRRSEQDGLRHSLADAVSIALIRTLRLPDARLAIREKESTSRSAFSDFFPTLNVKYIAMADKYMQQSIVQALAGSHDSRWFVRYGPPAQFPLGIASNPDYPYRIDPYRSFTLTGTLTQPIFSGGRTVNTYKFAQLGVDYSRIQYDVERQNLILEVNEAYYDMMQGEKLLEVAIQSIMSLEALRNQTMEFFKAGVVPKVDVLSTEGQLATARMSKTQAETDIGKSRARLNQLLRYPQETPTKIVQDYGYAPSGYRIPDIYSVAAANRLEIRQANISVAQALALIKVAQADLMPSVNVQVQGSRLNDDWNPFDREAVNDWQIQGLFNWAFDAFRTRETVQSRRASYGRTFIARQQLVEQIMDQVKESYLDMKRAEEDIFNSRKAVEFRRENFRINQERYKEQVATYIEVLDAQRQLSQALGDYYTSLIQYRIGRAVLERQMGTIQ